MLGYLCLCQFFYHRNHDQSSVIKQSTKILCVFYAFVSGHVLGDCKQNKLKLLLHPIVRVYTCKCAANIVEKY